MSNGRLKPLPEFWADNGLTRTQWHYLKKIRRAPKTIPLGTKEMVSPEAEDEWREDMQARPLTGSLRKLAEAAAAEPQPALATA
jgi:hypothetical protein